MSQSDTITLSVDVLNSGTPTDEVYTSYSTNGNVHTYIGADHQSDQQNTLKFYRTEPVVSGIFRGYLDTKVSFGQDFSVLGTDGSTLPGRMAFASLQIRVPVGVSAADILHLRQRLLAVLDNDVIMEKLNSRLEI